MSDSNGQSGLAVTFRVAEKHDSPETDQLLVDAVFHSRSDIRCGAATALMARRGQLPIVSLIQEVERLEQDVCEEFRRQPERFRMPLGQCLSGQQPALRMPAIEFVRRTCNLNHLSTIADLVLHSDDDIRTAADRTLQALCDGLAGRVLDPGSPVLSDLSQEGVIAFARERYEEVEARLAEAEPGPGFDSLLLATLTLGCVQPERLRSLLDRSRESVRQQVFEVLLNATSPALFRTICESLGVRFSFPMFFELLQRRDDPAFVQHFLAWLPARTSEHLRTTLAHVSELSWLSLDHETLKSIPDCLHRPLCRLMKFASLSKPLVMEIKAWIVKNSTADGRDACSEVLLTLPSTEVQQILYDALSSSDTEVEAWATRHLRGQKMPDAFNHLLSRINDDQNSVRDAARSELSTFNLPVVLELFPGLPESTAHRCGELLVTLDPETWSQLGSELKHSFRWRRVRAVNAVGALGYASHMKPDLLQRLADEDSNVRRLAIEVLATSPDETTVNALRRCRNDRSLSVRNAAQEVLARIQQQLLATAGATAP